METNNVTNNDIINDYSINQKLTLITQNLKEIIGSDELKLLLTKSKNKTKAYWVVTSRNLYVYFPDILGQN